MGPAPRLVHAMAEYGLGQKAEARKTLAAAIGSFNWRSAADTRDVWIFHVLRREAETLILPTLHAYLDGKYQPVDNEERFALLDGCRYMNRPCAMARLYTEAFAADPQLAEDYGLAHRLNAARAAALAGCGRGDDGANLEGEAERTRWRRTAGHSTWLETRTCCIVQEIGRRQHSGPQTRSSKADKLAVRTRISPGCATRSAAGKIARARRANKVACTLEKC